MQIMHGKGAQNTPDLVAISVRVPRETAERLKDIADGEFRPVAAEVRRLIEAHVDELFPDSKAAA